MVNQYSENFKKITVLKLDWGRSEENQHTAVTNRMFSQKLENLALPIMPRNIMALIVINYGLLTDVR